MRTDRQVDSLKNGHEFERACVDIRHQVSRVSSTEVDIQPAADSQGNTYTGQRRLLVKARILIAADAEMQSQVNVAMDTAA